MGQTSRLTSQHKKSHGAIGIFGEEAKLHDAEVAKVSMLALKELQEKYASLTFRCRKQISKEEINQALQKVDNELGTTLFVPDATIRPDGGIIEVKDDSGNWRVVLVSEAKHQGKDIENIRNGVQVGKHNDQDLMVAGNAIERAFKNVFEIANFMLGESHFPYVLFLEGSNFLTEDIRVQRPDGRIVLLNAHSGALNLLDRLTAANYGMALNANHCKNRFVLHHDKAIMLQATSLFTQGDGEPWKEVDMLKVMLEVAETSLQVLARDLFVQLSQR